MAMKDKTTITVSGALLEQLTVVRDYLAASAKRNPKAASPGMLRGQVGLGAAVEELCRRYFMGLERAQKHTRSKQAAKHQAEKYAATELQRLADDGSPVVAGH